MDFDTNVDEKLLFHTPNGQSYLCADVGKVNVTATVAYDYPNLPKQKANLLIHATSFRFDAFRNVAKNSPSGWRVSNGHVWK